MLNIKEIIKYTKKIRLLYVEDEELMRESAIEMLENFFDSIKIAKDGEEALHFYKNEEFDLVITDIAMPKMDGISLIKEIRNEDKKIPIIVFSALNDTSYMTACVSLNVDGYILKPMKKNNILNVLEKIVHKLSYSNNLQKISPKIETMVEKDALTELKSHSVLMQDLESIQANEIPVMILVNIDSFYIYNELYGLETGDEILQQFAQNLKRFSSSLSYELYRMNGDEFILLEKAMHLDTDKYEEDIESLFDYVESSPIKIKGVQELIVPSISIGISFHGDNLYGRADMALHEARRRGRKYLGFSADADIRKDLANNLYWREEINNAIAQDRVHAYYHPIVDKEENILKYESLIRIKQVSEDGKVSIIAPSEFLDFSKISKQYIALTQIMINESFKTMIEQNVHVAINLTFHDIENREINKLLHERIIKHKLANKTKFDISTQVIFELLQHSSHDDYDRLVAFVDEFKMLGVLITIDNFGMGFDNMSKISALSPNYVKIDAMLIKNIDTDKHAYTLVKSIVKFAQELGIKTIAEHVVNKEIFDASIKLGIDEFQGYYFGEPLERITAT